MTSKSLIQYLLLFVALLKLSGSAAYAQSKQSEVVLEITREGAGMIFPLKKQVYFRLDDNGLLEYETLPILSSREQNSILVASRLAQFNRSASLRFGAVVGS